MVMGSSMLPDQTGSSYKQSLYKICIVREHMLHSVPVIVYLNVMHGFKRFMRQISSSSISTTTLCGFWLSQTGHSKLLDRSPAILIILCL